MHNLKNVSLEIPRDSLIVVTGLSGSGKSSLAFDTIYAEGQRRYMESLSSYAKRFVAQVAKPDVDFVFGLSPVISIEQKTIGSNPRSTVGTMTDIASYLNLLFATIGRAALPAHRRADAEPERRTRSSRPSCRCRKGRRSSCARRCSGSTARSWISSSPRSARRAAGGSIIDGKPVDISAEVALDESKVRDMDAVVDRFVVGRKHEKAIKAGIAATLLVGDGLMQVQVIKGASKAEAERFYKGLCSPTHHFVYGGIEPEYFMFNNPESACRTCGGLGIYKITHPELLVPDPKRSILRRLFRARGVQVQPGHLGRPGDVHAWRRRCGSRWTSPGKSCPSRRATRSSTASMAKKLMIDRAARRQGQARRIGKGQEVGFGGIARRIERQYRRYRQRGEANSGMEEWLDKVMVERTCPDCKGARLRATRLLFTIAGKTIHDVGGLNFDELHTFLGTLEPTGRGADAGRQVLGEIRGRLELLLGIGLDYLNLNRRSGTLSGGESQRIRLSTQIGSGLMGMLYVLDEPSIGLHPKDNVKMIATLESLRDIGNTVIVVEHDEDTIRAADHIVEMGPGPGVHGGQRRGARDARRRHRVQGVADRAVPLRQAVDRDARTASQGQRQDADRARGPREQLESGGRRVPARQAGRGHGRVRFGQEHAHQ